MTVRGPLSISTLLNRDVRDERSLSLAREAAYVARHDRDNAEIRYMVLFGSTLGRRALMDLLYTLAPYQAHGPDRFARVLDNWRLHDRAKTSSSSESLLLQHAKSLKTSWEEFSEHREVFISILADDTENTRVMPFVTWVRKPLSGVRRWEFGAVEPGLVRSLQALVPILRSQGSERLQLDSLVGLVTVPYFLPELRKKWRAWQPLDENGKSNYIGPASVPVVALMHRRALLNSAFVRSAEACIDAPG